MRRTFQVLLAGWVVLNASPPAWAASRPDITEGAGANLTRQWADAHSFLAQGAYRDALQSLDIILTITPDDPWAQLYHDLCERRLQSPTSFRRLSIDQLGSLKQTLRLEEELQRKTHAKGQVLERELRREQAKWDNDLALLRRQAEAEERARREEAEREALQHARAERATAEEIAQQQALKAATAQAIPESTAKAPAELSRPADQAVRGRESAPEAPQQPPIISTVPTPQRSVELSPVRVPTAPLGPPGVPQPAEPVSPGPPERPTPPAGAVQINARSMHVLSDRNLAIAEGDVEVLFENAILTCDRLTLFTDTKDVYAEGRVRLEDGAQLFRGEMIHYNFEAKKGRFLQGTVSSPPWHEHGRSVETLAEGVYRVTPGYLTSCELEPPHFRFAGRQATVFAEDKITRSTNVTLFAEQLPLLYLPWLSVAERQTPFFLIPGKKKPWEQFALMGYRYEWPEGHNGALRLDWRRAFGWGTGVDHQFDTEQLGKGLLKLYYNEERNIRRPESDLPKGASINRYRVLLRQRWQPLRDTTVLTDLQKYSDVDFRRELLFREEFVEDDTTPESFVSLVTNDEDYTLSALLRKRLNRFQTVTEAYPEVSLTTRSQRIGETNVFSTTSGGFANLQTKETHAEADTDVVRATWSQGFDYALNWFRPIEVTPGITVAQAYHTKDKQGGLERPDGERDVISTQFSTQTTASLKLFRVFPVITNALGLNINWLRHVLTPTIRHQYVHRPTVPNDNLSFGTAAAGTNKLTFGLENKLQTKRPVTAAGSSEKRLASTAAPSSRDHRSVDLARFLIAVPYTFRGHHNKVGGELSDWTFDLELFPYPWMRIESDWSYPSHFVKGSRDRRLPGWNLDLVMVGGKGQLKADTAPEIQAPAKGSYLPEVVGGVSLLIPEGQWYLGLRHAYSQNGVTEDVVEFDWRLSKKWEVGTFHRITWKEVAEGSKRFTNLRERQYRLRRDLHDWLADVVYREDREFGEEVFFTLTLKAYPQLPIEIEEAYHQPKVGSQSSPFSPVARR